MLDLGFLPDVERLLAKTPETRQTMLFSATMPAAIVVAGPHPHAAPDEHPRRVVVRHHRWCRRPRSSSTRPTTSTSPRSSAGSCRPRTPTRSSSSPAPSAQAQRVADDLAERGFSASPLHGDMAQVAREKALAKFREDKIRVLVATDVAARGIDVAGVSHVINYTCPEDDKTYVHRIGRTGRAGATGIAITFVDWADLHRWKMINKALDLPFDEPQETYSTSEHLFHDLGIAAGHQGPHRRPAPRSSAKPARRDRGERSGERVGERPRPQPRPQPHPDPQRRAASGGRRRGRGTGRRRRRAGATATGAVAASAGGSRSRDRRVAVSESRCDASRRLAAELRSSTTERRARDRAQAVTTTVVPSGAKSHSAIASGRYWRMQPCDCGVPSWARSAPACRRRPGCRGSRWRPVVALGEPDEVPHRPGVVDRPTACSERE